MHGRRGIGGWGAFSGALKWEPDGSAVCQKSSLDLGLFLKNLTRILCQMRHEFNFGKSRLLAALLLG